MNFYMKMKYLQNLQIDDNKKESNGTWEACKKKHSMYFYGQIGNRQ